MERRLPPPDAIDPVVRAAAVGAARPRTPVEALGAGLGIGERQLRRRFDDAVGYGPKTLQRVLRFQRFLALAEAERTAGGADPDLARLAFAAGYADQAHLTRECTRLAGLPPAALLATGAGPGRRALARVRGRRRGAGRRRLRPLRRGAVCDPRAVFDHVTIRVSDRAASERFYDTVLAALGIEQRSTATTTPSGTTSRSSQARTRARRRERLHIGFSRPSREHVDAFWRAGVDAGYRDDGAPGPRPQYRDDYYGAFLLDPDGNSAEAVHHGDAARDGVIDHLWIRVADVAAATRFYATIAPHARASSSAHDSPERAQFVGGASGSFSLVAGRADRELHMAFPAADDATVDAFHAAATDAGYRDNGAPGERPEYHPGYYGAFVLDPDGNNIEVVNHNRG